MHRYYIFIPHLHISHTTLWEIDFSLLAFYWPESSREESNIIHFRNCHYLNKDLHTACKVLIEKRESYSLLVAPCECWSRWCPHWATICKPFLFTSSMNLTSCGMSLIGITLQTVLKQIFVLRFETLHRFLLQAEHCCQHQTLFCSELCRLHRPLFFLAALPPFRDLFLCQLLLHNTLSRLLGSTLVWTVCPAGEPPPALVCRVFPSVGWSHCCHLAQEKSDYKALDCSLSFSLLLQYWPDSVWFSISE